MQGKHGDTNMERANHTVVVCTGLNAVDDSADSKAFCLPIWHTCMVPIVTLHWLTLVVWLWLISFPYCVK